MSIITRKGVFTMKMYCLKKSVFAICGIFFISLGNFSTEVFASEKLQIEFNTTEVDSVELSTPTSINSIVDSYYAGKSSRAYTMWQKSIFKKLLTQWVPPSVVNPTYDYESFSQYSISGSSKQNLFVCAFSSENNMHGFVVMEYTGDGLKKEGLYMTSHAYDLNANIETITEGLNETNLNMSMTTAERMRLEGKEVIVFTDASGKRYACYLDNFSFKHL